MSFAIVPCDGVDFTLLMRAAEKASSTTLRELTHERLRALAADEGIDFATAVLYARTRREYAACAARIDDLYQAPAADTPLRDATFVYVPNLGYFIDPKSQAIGGTVCRAAERLGCRSVDVQTSLTGDLRTNARIVCDALGACQQGSVILMSVSKGSADVVAAFNEPDAGTVFQNVVAWIEVCGLSDGIPILNRLQSDEDGQFEKQILYLFRHHDPNLVRDFLAIAHELGYGPGYPLHDRPITTPPHIMRLNATGFPTRRHLTKEVSRALYEELTSFGPNDGYGILRDVVARPGETYAIWGTDHYFRREIDVERLAGALIAYAAERAANGPPPTDQQDSRPMPALPSRPQTVAPARMRGAPGGELRDHNDWERLRHARARHDGFSVGRYLQAPPMLFTRDGHNVFLGDMYRGRAAFLLCGGPSLASHDLAQLDQRGILTCAVNNTAAVYRPHLWVSVDDPGNFVDAIWRDAGILKFVPLCHMEKHFIVRNERDELVPSEELVGDMPAVFGYRRNESFREAQWLYEDTFNWGNHSKHLDSDGNKGSRSVMYVAIRLLFYLGIRRLYLLGCDFRMDHDKQNYAFDQDRSRSSVRGNNDSYRILNDRLARLKPHFDREGFAIFNCTPNSGLTVFPHLAFEDAVADATADIPRKINTAGMYDRQQRERDAQKAQAAQETETPAPSERPVVVKPHDVVRSNGNARLPELTLVTAVDRDCLPKLALTWPTWMQYRPELRTMPVMIIHDESLDPDSSECKFLCEHPNLRFVRWSMTSAQSQREKMLSAYVMIPARELQTSWYLKLDADVFAKPADEWIKPEWFAPDKQQRVPAYVSSPWGYTKPANAIAVLDEWGDRVPELRQHPRLDLPYDRSASRVVHPRIASWCFYGNTAWTREIAAYVVDRLPCPSQDTYVFYCATRRRDYTVRVPMSRFGWQHVAGSVRRLRRCCQQALEVCHAP
jgi:hypothetical protein